MTSAKRVMCDLKLYGSGRTARASKTDWFECVPPFVRVGDQPHQPDGTIRIGSGGGKLNRCQAREAIRHPRFQPSYVSCLTG